jgi:hypothetical protein
MIEFKQIGSSKYFVSPCGIVRNNEKVIKQSDRGGYRSVNLSIDGVIKGYRVHRLVAMVYIENPLSKKFVNHLNGVKHDNRVENLEWCTNQENTLHAYQVLKVNHCSTFEDYHFLAYATCRVKFSAPQIKIMSSPTYYHAKRGDVPNVTRDVLIWHEQEFNYRRRGKKIKAKQ